MTKKKRDVLESLKGKLEKRFSDEALDKQLEKRKRLRMHNTREWSMTYGNGKIPTWTKVRSSTNRAIIQANRAWYMTRQIPTRVRVKLLKSGKKRYYLDLYNHTARKLRK